MIRELDTVANAMPTVPPAPAAEHHGERLQRLRRAMQRAGLAGAVLRSSANRIYFKGSEESEFTIVLNLDEVVTTSLSDVAIATALDELGLSDQRIGSDAAPGRATADAAQVVDLSPEIYALRRVKDDFELRAISRSAECIDRGFDAARAVTAQGAADDSIIAAARSAVERTAVDHVEFAYNIGIGALGSDPDASCCGAIVDNGDAVFIDLYPRVGDYFGDATRTFFVGDPSKRVAEAVDALWVALDRSSTLLRPGTSASEVDRRCREALASSSFAADYPHHTGHGVGLEQQEPPWIVPDSMDVLVAGDVIALEPGIYTGDFGVRVEELFVVREDGPALLSHADRSPWREAMFGA